MRRRNLREQKVPDTPQGLNRNQMGQNPAGRPQPTRPWEGTKKSLSLFTNTLEIEPKILPSTYSTSWPTLYAESATVERVIKKNFSI